MARIRWARVARLVLSDPSLCRLDVVALIERCSPSRQDRLRAQWKAHAEPRNANACSYEFSARRSIRRRQRSTSRRHVASSAPQLLAHDLTVRISAHLRRPGR